MATSQLSKSIGITSDIGLKEKLRELSQEIYELKSENEKLMFELDELR